METLVERVRKWLIKERSYSPGYVLDEASANMAAFARTVLEDAAKIPEDIAAELSSESPMNLAFAYALQNISKAIRQLAGESRSSVMNGNQPEEGVMPPVSSDLQTGRWSATEASPQQVEGLAPERLREIEEREQKATKGPWVVKEYDGGHKGVNVKTDPHDLASWPQTIFAPHVQYDGFGSGGAVITDADFIAHARKDIPDLLAEVKRLQGERDEALQANQTTTWIAVGYKQRAETAEADSAILLDRVRGLTEEIQRLEAALREAQAEIHKHQSGESYDLGFQRGSDAAALRLQGGEPSGYAYRYPDCIRFSHGQEINGWKPTEAIPYYFGKPLPAPPAAEPEKASPAEEGAE